MRELGYYWVKNTSGFWFICEWNGGHFTYKCWTVAESDISEIKEERIKHPDEKNEKNSSTIDK